jgi:hypothetical protein
MSDVDFIFLERSHVERFHELNSAGQSLKEDEFYQAMIDIAEKRLTKAGLAELLRSALKSRK